MMLSIVSPVFNERENLPLLFAQIETALSSQSYAWELVLVDDGSTDGSDRALAELAGRDHRVKVITLRRNYGQTAALAAGIDHATGNVIVTLDADLQNEPADIPLLVERLQEGYDLVYGWRKERHDALLSRRLPSMAANWLISRAAGFTIHDAGCTLKAFRSELARELELTGEMHRFIPVLAAARGAGCHEMVTRHHPRRFGRSKYGISRTFRVVLDLCTVLLLTRFLSSPLKLLGGVGLAGLLLGGAMAAVGIGTTAATSGGLLGMVLMVLGSVAILGGVQLIGLGMVCELLARTYLAATGRRVYDVRSRLNCGEADEEGAPATLRLRAA